MRQRTQVLNRTLYTEAQNKMLTDWTLPKMVIQAKIEEKAHSEREEELRKMKDLGYN